MTHEQRKAIKIDRYEAITEVQDICYKYVRELVFVHEWLVKLEDDTDVPEEYRDVLVEAFNELFAEWSRLRCAISDLIKS